MIEPTSRQLVAELPGSGFILGVHAVSNPPGFVCDVQGLEFFWLGHDGILWHTRRLALDGFNDVRFTGTRITGLGQNWSLEWVPFEVDLKSAAKIDLAWALRKVFHGVRPPRSGAGWIPFLRRIALIVFGQTT